MVQLAFAVIDVSLARPALEEYRNSDKRLLLFDGAPESRRGTLADVPFALKKPVVALTGRDKITANVEFVAFDSDRAVNESSTARMIGKAESDAWLSRHDKFLSQLW